MENLKIRVTTEQESKEAQELFFELGYRWPANGRIVCHAEYKIIHAWDDGGLTRCNNEVGDFSKFKEITPQELRDMAVLKRNEESDATHINKNTDERYLKIGEEWYVYHGDWVKSARNEEWILNKTTPITETEYLMQGENGARLNESVEQLRPTAKTETLNDKVASAEVARQDNVNNPSHYNKGGVECIDAIQSSMTKEAFCGYLKGNIQKYVFRYENKGGVESLQKAQWYLNKLIEIEAL